MCNPTAMLALQGGQMLFGGLGAANQASQQKAMLDYNAKLSDMAAQDATNRGNQAAQQSQLRTAQLKGTQRAALAASGVDMGQGSALNTLASTDYMGEQDVNMIKYNAAREAWGYKTKGAQFRSQSKMISPWMAGLTSVLGSAGSNVPQWYDMYKNKKKLPPVVDLYKK